MLRCPIFFTLSIANGINCIHSSLLHTALERKKNVALFFWHVSSVSNEKWLCDLVDWVTFMLAYYVSYYFRATQVS